MLKFPKKSLQVNIFVLIIKAKGNQRKQCRSSGKPHGVRVQFGSPLYECVGLLQGHFLQLITRGPTHPEAPRTCSHASQCSVATLESLEDQNHIKAFTRGGGRGSCFFTAPTPREVTHPLGSLFWKPQVITAYYYR